MRILYIILFALIPSQAFANRVLIHVPTDTVLESASSAKDEGLITNGVQMGYPANELQVVEMEATVAMVRIKNQEWGTLATAKTRRIKELRQEGKAVLQGMTGYFLGNSTTRDALWAGVRQGFLDAKTAVNSCADVACVRAVQPVWPVDTEE